jgi:hypothetical protein
MTAEPGGASRPLETLSTSHVAKKNAGLPAAPPDVRALYELVGANEEIVQVGDAARRST